jgi:tRNA-specific 2-thiouridylase
VKQLFVIDCEQGYEKNIITPMVSDYKKGLTPNPDILCNNVGKFPGLLRKAKKIKADFIATGHYARIKKTKKGFSLLRGKDREKDQSYFLAGLPQKILQMTLFPIGNLTKKEVRKIAKRNKFPNWNKRSSRGICYLGKIDVKKFLKSRIKLKPGKILSPEGKVIGTHPGAMFFTIGERVRDKKGLNIDNEYRKKNPRRLFIAKKKANNIIVIAPEKHLLLKTKKVFIKGFKMMNPKDKISKTNLKARIRHLGKLNSGKLKKEKGRYVFEFLKGQEGVAEGQIIAIYKGDALVASGEIRLK